MELKGVSKSFGKKQVIDSLDLDLYKKDFLGIIGMSGCGKTTLMKLMVGFLTPENGAISLSGKELVKHSIDSRRLFGFATQEGSFYPDLSVKQNLCYFARLYGMKRNEIEPKVNELINQLHLEDCLNDKAKSLSKGMQRRLDIACSIIHTPDILFLDEPTADLHPALRKEVLQLVRGLNKQGMTIVMTSQMLDEVEAFCSRIALLHNRKIVRTGTLKELKGELPNEGIIVVKTSPGDYKKVMLKSKNTKEFTNIMESDEGLKFYTKNINNALDKIVYVLKRSKENILDVNVRKPSVQEAFSKLVG